MKTIIVPTDFSPSATNAVNYAADMAIQIKARLLLFNIYQVPIAVTDAPLMLLSVDELRSSAEKRLEDLKNNLVHVTSGQITIVTEVRMGDVVDELESLCEDTQPFAVVMGTMGHSAVERTLFGSTTLSAIKHLTWPVICVPIGKEYGLGIKKAGLACDFRHVVETTPVAAIRSIVNELKAELHVLNVEVGQSSPSDKPEQYALLDTALDGMNPQYHFIKGKDIEDGINQFAEENNLDLIIAIPKKHKLLDGLFKKSSTKQLVFQAHVPVLCVHE